MRGFQVNPIKQRDWKTLHWEAGTDPSLCYYRIYLNNVRIGSTTTNEYVDAVRRAKVR